MDNPRPQMPALTLNAPNAITAIRIVLSALIVWLLMQGMPAQVLLAGILLVLAWATDGLDGFLARKLGQTSLGGGLFDLVADRMLMTPALIVAIANGLWARTAGLMPFNPYPYAIVVIAGDLTVLAGVCIFLWKYRTRELEFPAPTQIARITYSVQMLTLSVGILGIGPDMLLAALMYLAIIFTLLSFYSYLRKSSYVFTS